MANSLNTKLILLTLRKVAAEVVKTTKAAATGSKNNITGRADGHNIIVFSDQITPLIKIMQIMHALRQRVPVTLHRNRDQPDERSTTLEVDQEIEEDINPETESDVDGDDVNDHQDVLNHPIPSSSSSSSSAPAAAVLPTNSSINVVLPGQVIPSSFTTSDFRDGEVQSIIHLMEEGSPELGESVGDGSEYLPLLLPDNSSSSSTGLIGNESNPPDLTHSSSISSLGITPELHRMRITTTNDLELGEIIPLPGAGHQQISVAPQTDGPSSSTASSTSSLDVIARTMLGVASDRSRGDASNIALASDLRSPLSSSSSSTSSLRSTFRKGTKSATLAAHNCSNPNCSSSLHRAASKWEKMTTTDMREVFISLAPSNVNDETIEYVEHLLETIELEVVDDETEELDRVLDWIRDVIDWQRANKVGRMDGRGNKL